MRTLTAVPCYNPLINSVLKPDFDSDGDVDVVAAFSMSNGDELWRAQVSTEVTSVPAAGNGIVAVHTDDGKISGISIERPQRGAFHEAVTNQILDDLVALLAPRRMTVEADFYVRGGIRTVVEASHP